MAVKIRLRRMGQKKAQPTDVVAKIFTAAGIEK